MKYNYNTVGLNEKESKELFQIINELFSRIKTEKPWMLTRCTFFADGGFGLLENIIKKYNNINNLRVEGCDHNPFDQHYWLAFDMKIKGNCKSVLIDPIFNYIGLEEYARSNYYYENKREIKHGTPAWEGGIRIKTIPI